MITKIGLYRDSRKKKPRVVRWFGGYDPATGQQRRYSKSFQLKRDAEEFQNQPVVAFKDGQQRDRPEEITLKDFCGDWLKTKRVEFRPETVVLYKNVIGRLVDYFGPDCHLSQISPRVAAKFIAELNRLDGRNDDLSNWARHRALRNCKTMFQDAVTWEIIAKNPFTGVKAPKCITRSWHYLQPEEFARLLNASHGNNITNPEVVRILAGHADLQTTMKYYAQADSEQMEKAAAVIDALLNKTDAGMTPDTDFGQ